MPAIVWHQCPADELYRRGKTGVHGMSTPVGKIDGSEIITCVLGLAISKERVYSLLKSAEEAQRKQWIIRE